MVEKCGAKTRAGGGHPCKLVAGHGTGHKGTGRCKYHGGSVPSGPDLPYFKHGRYAEAFKGKLRRKFIETVQDDNPLDLLPELAVQRTLLQDFISRFDEGIPISGSNAKYLSALANDVVNTATKIISSRNQTALTVAEVKYLQIGITALLDEFIPDPDQRRAFITRLLGIIPQAAITDRSEG